MAPRSPSSPTQNSQSYETATYGNVDDGPHVVGEGDDAGSPLLGGGPRKVAEDENEREGTATLASGIGKLQHAPHAMASSGIIPGIITCIFSGAVAAFGLHLLSVCATRTAHRKASFFAVSRMTFPKAAVFFDAAIAIKCFGVSISSVRVIRLTYTQ
ncbi:hypothetical protein FRC00_002476 [Tulasnella sp. 408]|nr:hypothetical protein FRC00_002476 [Tulasnella sp. 408]